MNSTSRPGNRSRANAYPPSEHRKRLSSVTEVAMNALFAA